ncbi:hypothetical protein MBLNU459_g6198t1 [Dothideomycetes sp. NU459]
MPSSRIGFIGLGAMGGGVAINLTKSGYPVTGFDIAQPLVDKLVAAGGKAGTTPALTAKDAEFLCIMVANAAQTTSVLFDGADGAIHGLGQDKTVILLSTCPPAYLHELRQKLDDAGRTDIRLLDCPVSGGTIRAADGTLSIFSSGPDADLAHAHDVLTCMSGNLYKVEGGISSGTKVKTIHQLIAATNIILASEAMGLAATVKLNTPAVVDHVKRSDGTSFMFENRAPHMLADDWTPLSALAIILKDCGIVTATARAGAFPVPLASCAEQLYLQGVAAGLLRDDDAKLVTLYLPREAPSLVARGADANVRMVASHQVSADTVNDLLTGVHLAASVEAMAFCKHLGMDRRLMCTIISKAAGWCDMFTRHIPGMLEKDEWTLAHCEGATDVRKRLEEAVRKCAQIGYPCSMAAAALQQYYFADKAK